MYIIYVNDTETTGTDPVKNDIIELSMGRVIISDSNKITIDQKTWHMAPINPSNIENEALAINGYKREDILLQTEYGRNTFKSAKDVVPQVELWMNEDDSSVYDRLFVGHNAPFDSNFMLNTWDKTGNKSSFPFDVTNGNRILDTKQIIMFIDLCTGKRRKFYNLGSCVKSFGVKKGKAHKAEEDVKMTIDLLLKALIPVREIIGKQFMNCYAD